MVGTPLWRWNWRAILMAASTASEPPDRNFIVVYSAGVMSRTSLASSSARSLVPIVGVAMASRPSCSLPAAMRALLPWPRLRQNVPDNPSM